MTRYSFQCTDDHTEGQFAIFEISKQVLVHILSKNSMYSAFCCIFKLYHHE